MSATVALSRAQLEAVLMAQAKALEDMRARNVDLELERRRLRREAAAALTSEDLRDSVAYRRGYQAGWTAGSRSKALPCPVDVVAA